MHNHIIMVCAGCMTKCVCPCVLFAGTGRVCYCLTDRLSGVVHHKLSF